MDRDSTPDTRLDMDTIFLSRRTLIWKNLNFGGMSENLEYTG